MQTSKNKNKNKKQKTKNKNKQTTKQKNKTKQNKKQTNKQTKIKTKQKQTKTKRKTKQKTSSKNWRIFDARWNAKLHREICILLKIDEVEMWCAVDNHDNIVSHNYVQYIELLDLNFNEAVIYIQNIKF